MHPTLLELGPVKIHSYGLMLAVGFLLCLHLTRKQYKATGGDPDMLSDMGFGVLLTGLLGTRLLHIFMFPTLYSWSDPLGWIALWRGGLVFQGAFLAFIFAYFFLRRRKVPFLPTVDVILPYLPLGHAVGRLGCFLNGCCYGKVSDVPWAIRFPRVPFSLDEEVVGGAPYLDHCENMGLSVFSDQWSLPVHPTQLYSFAGLLCLFAVMRFIYKKNSGIAGITIPAYMVLYGILRVVIEFFRGDHNPRHFNDLLSSQQIYSIIMVIAGLAILAVLLRMAKKNTAKDDGKASAG